jgi:hypothetical protein
MIKTLRITSVVAAILAGIFFVFPVVFGVRSDEQIDEFVSSPGVREKFEAAASSKEKSNESQASPLVQQAEAFAMYLNPPKSNPLASQAPKGASIVSPMPATTPKFKLFGTSYFESNPELSLAFIDEAGKGRHWIRQSDKVGRLLIERVKDGLVVVKSGEETFEVAVEKGAEAAPVGAASPVSAQTASQSRFRPALSSAAKTSSEALGVARPIPQLRKNPQDDAKLEELARKIIDVQRSSTSGKSDQALSDAEKTARTVDLISQYKSATRATRVTPNEAKKLGNLGETLESTQGDPNQILPAESPQKAEGGPPEPNSPPAK